MDRDLRAMKLFEQASQLEPNQRSLFLEQHCGEDAELRDYVESLIVTMAETDGFLEQGPLPISASLLGQLDPTSSDPLLSQVTIQPSEVLCNRYQIVEQIGLGGMGSVYLAKDMRLDRDVAIKALYQHMLLDAKMRQRFEREVKAVAALSHPNIVTLFDFVSHEGLPLAVMEYVTGQTLRKRAEQGLKVSSALQLVSDIAAGLDAAHQRGVMHRDIKPENIMVTTTGSAKILDFGLARQDSVSDSLSLTATHQVPGTPPYMSPEQVLSTEVGCPTDIFSLGTVLFELLTGENPFRGSSALETMQRISHQAAPVLCHSSNLPDELMQLVHSMLSRDTHQRPTAGMVRDTLRNLVLQGDAEQILGKAGFVTESTHAQHASLTPPMVEPPTNLPLRSAELTGRTAELFNLSQLLADSRVVTVLGAGGVGKTSLAYEAARQTRGLFPGGVWLCELAPLRNKDGVLEVLAGALEGNAGAINKFEEVVARLGSEPTLVLFDNCEHVIDAAAELIDRLSQQLPKLTILTTSREALKIAGESVLRLEGLDRTDAMTLFVTRAAEQAGFKDDSQLEDLVTQIVQQLEGLPLAIELAAPKLGVMTLSELLDALDNQLTTLSTGRRSLDRQSAIDQTIAWSFDLLEPEEQKTLLALSVFAAWFTSEAAVEVSGLGPGAKMHLLRLAEQSVVARKEEQGRSRYRLLEPIRQFCQARIEQNALEIARERHARYYANRAIKTLSLGISGYDELDCSHAVNVEWPDLREAIAWGRQHRVAEVAIDPCVAMARTAVFQLRLELFEWLISAEDSMPEMIANNPGALAAIAWGYWLMGRREKTQEYLQHLETADLRDFSLWTKGYLVFYLGDYNTAIELWTRYRQNATQDVPDCEKRWARSAVEVAAHLLGGSEDQRIDELMEIAAQQGEGTDWPTGESIYWSVMVLIMMGRGDNAGARRAASTAVERARIAGNRFVGLGIAAVYSGLSVAPGAEKPAESLRSVLDAYQDLLETNNPALLPITARGLVVAMTAFGATEAASRGSVVAERLSGIGDQSEYTPEYSNALKQLRSELGDKRYEQLREEGRSLDAWELLKIGTQLLDAQDDQSA